MSTPAGDVDRGYRVADIDLDLFLDRFDNIDCGKHRQPSTLRPWSHENLRAFLEGQCGFKPGGNRVPGRFIIHHDEAWEIFRQLRTWYGPLDLVHFDAHADLGTGLGDLAWVDIGSRLLGLERDQRPDAILRMGDKRMSPANYIAFVVACRWIKSLTYVHHPLGGEDLMPFFFRDFDVASGFIEMRFIQEGMDDAIAMLSHERLRALPHRLEPAIPFSKIGVGDYRAASAFDFVILCQSPGYTPAEADELIPVFSDYIDFEADLTTVPRAGIK